MRSGCDTQKILSTISTSVTDFTDPRPGLLTWNPSEEGRASGSQVYRGVYTDSESRLATMVEKRGELTESNQRGKSVAVTVAFAALLIKALLDAIAPVLRKFLPAVPFFAQSFFVLRWQFLPAINVSPHSIFFFGRKIKPIVSGSRCRTGRRRQKQSKKCCCDSAFTHLTHHVI